MKSFHQLVDEILELRWQTSPVTATFDGIHKYDHELDRLDRDFLLDVHEKEKYYLRELEKIDPTKLTEDEQLDYNVLTNALEVKIREFEHLRMWERDPSIYINIPLYGVFTLILREFAPVGERLESILKRLYQVPRLIDEAKHNLKNSPAIYTKIAIEKSEASINFFKHLVPKFAEQVPKLKSHVTKASMAAAESFDKYCRFLKEEYLANSKGEFPIGRELFDYKLKVEHMLDWDADDLLEIGESTLNRVKDELNKLAGSIEPTKGWVTIVEELKSAHPPADELLDYYRREMQHTREFTTAKNIVSIPPEEGLEVIETPQFARPTIPYAAYMPPAPFEKQQKGFFYVTPATTEEQLCGHSIYSIPIVALHEGYPGHHLQLLWANRVASKVRKVYGTSVFVEGWALYCEELFYELGYYTDPRIRLMQLKDELWRACRVIIDVKLHTRQMSFDDAVKFLVDEAKLEPVNAKAEVKRYTSSPTQPMSYIIGKKQIMELRHKYSGDLREFHNKLLSFGSLPIKLIRGRL